MQGYHLTDCPVLRSHFSEYNAAQLAEALSKLEGFTYAPSETHWWRHGHSSERDFIYVTTQNLPDGEEASRDRDAAARCQNCRAVHNRAG